MTISEELHKSKFHREGFDTTCPQCLKEQGIPGVVRHLQYCAMENERHADNFSDEKDRVGAQAVAREQRRMIGVLKAYMKATGD